MTKLLLVEDDASVRITIQTFLEFEGYAVDSVASTSGALDKLSANSYPIIISDIYIDSRTGIDVLNAARAQDPACCVILMSARGSIETVMAATRGGAFDYLAKPFDLEKLLETVRRAEASREDHEKETALEELPATECIGSSAGMVEIYKRVALIAPTDMTVLIEGETGTGKEVIARMIHRNSSRASHPFVPVDCAGIAPTLIESELFGAMRGAFTGADRDRVGVFEAAHKGTVLLDEIGEVDLNFQMKLLRFLQEREIRPVGASRSKPVDVRVIAATNRRLHKLVEEGKFRSDLWFRLNVTPIEVPPLRERRVDIPLLATFFLNHYNGKYGQSTRLMDSGMKAMREQPWPGNVRQLQHLIERLTILAPGGQITGETVHDAIAATESRDHSVETLADAEQDQIRRVLAATGGNKSRAAQILGIERKTLYRKLERMSPN